MGIIESKPLPVTTSIQQNTTKIEALAKALDIKAERQRQTVNNDGWDRLEQDKKSMQVLKSLFKKLDPTVVKSPTDMNGEIELSFKYDEKRQLLLVKVIKCKYLQAKDIRTKASDPYVRLQLCPDLHSHGAKVTQIVVDTRDPVYNEIFAFKIQQKGLEETKLVVQVFDYDPLTHDDFLGEVVVDLTQFDFEKDPVLTAWYTLHMETDLNITGWLEVSLRFLLPRSLYLTVHKAAGLSNRPNGKTVLAFVKCTIPGTSCVHKTETVTGDQYPEWQETFEFDITKEELTFRHVILHVIDSNAFSENNILGQIIIDLDTLDLENGYHDNLKLADLRNSNQLCNKQQQHVAAQEFREAFHAHVCTRNPEFLFQQQTESKTVVTVTCRKAGAQGRVRILDGIPVY